MAIDIVFIRVIALVIFCFSLTWNFVQYMTIRRIKLQMRDLVSKAQLNNHYHRGMSHLAQAVLEMIKGKI